MNFQATSMKSIRTARAVAASIELAVNAALQAALIIVVVLITPSTVRDECLT